MTLGYNIPDSVPASVNPNTPTTTTINSIPSLDLSQTAYFTPLNPGMVIPPPQQPPSYGFPPPAQLNKSVEAAGEDEEGGEKKEDLQEEYEDYKRDLDNYKDEGLTGHKKTLHNKIKLRVQKKEKLEKLKQELKKDSSTRAMSCDYPEYPHLSNLSEKKNIKFNIKKRLKLRIIHQHTEDEMNGIKNDLPKLPVDKPEKYDGGGLEKFKSSSNSTKSSSSTSSTHGHSTSTSGHGSRMDKPTPPTSEEVNKFLMNSSGGSSSGGGSVGGKPTNDLTSSSTLPLMNPTATATAATTANPFPNPFMDSSPTSTYALNSGKNIKKKCPKKKKIKKKKIFFFF